MWWNNIKDITGQRKTSNEASHVNIDDSWINAQDFCDKINEHYLSHVRDTSFDIPEISNTSIRSYIINEWEIHPLLLKINTKKSTHSSDFPSWVTKNNADILDFSKAFDLMGVDILTDKLLTMMYLNRSSNF